MKYPIKMGFSVFEIMRRGMENENSSKQCCIAITSATNLAYAVACGLVYALWWANVSNIQNAQKTICDDSDCTNFDGSYIIYDVRPFQHYFSDMNNNNRDNFSDWDAASDYWSDLVDECGEPTSMTDLKWACW